MNQKPFVNFHTHSYYSILGGLMSPKVLLEKAHEAHCPALALTDTGVGHGLVEFCEQAAKFEANLKPILGAEIFVAAQSRFDKRPNVDGKEGYIVLIAQNQTGWNNLVKILSTAWLEGLYEKPRADWETLEKYKEGLFVLTGSTDGLIGKSLSQNNPKQAHQDLEKILSVYDQSQVFLELVANQGDSFETLNRFILDVTETKKLPVLVTSNARFSQPQDEEATEVLRCIESGEMMNNPYRKKFAEGHWFKSWQEMCDVLDYLPYETLEKARQESLNLAENIHFEMEFGKDLLPHFEVDQNEDEASQLRKNCEKNLLWLYRKDLGIEPFFEAGKNDEDWAQKVATEGLPNLDIPTKFNFDEETTALWNTILERLSYELSIIGKMGFDAYFLIVQDFIQYAKTHDISVGPGRGSAAGSIVSYLLGITTIDPIKYVLLFERFLNPERISMPDIDIDFSDEKRDRVLQYVIDRYGHEKVSKVCTFGTLSAKAALKDVGRALGVDYGEMNALTKLLPGTPGFKLKDAFDVLDFKAKVEANPSFQRVFDIARKIEGCIRHVSVHACAVIIGKEDLTNEVPIQWAPGTEKIKISQIPYQQLEHIGLLKMDFLGLKNLSILDKTLENIKARQNIDIDLQNIPLDDQKTFEMIARGETTGVFQFESDGMRRYLRELKPTEFEDLVAMNALYRPGPMEYIPTYIAGKHDPSTVKYMHPTLEPILKQTYGIAVYQEQVLQIARDFAGFSLGQADILRKAIGKKIASILAEQRQKFIEGGIANGYKKEDGIKLFDEIIVPFSGYGFNRSHAVCYARIAYETAYLRANYPVEFMAAMMTTDRNNTDRIVLEMHECHDMDIEVLPPSVNDSGSYFSVVGPNQIRFGLSAIKGLGEEPVNHIIEERNSHGTFTSIQDFAERVPAKYLNKKSLEALSFSGALDAFGDRKSIIESIEDITQFAKEVHEKNTSGQMGLFGGESTAVEFKLKPSKASKKEILNWERESLGLFVSDHPLKGLNEYFSKFGTPIGEVINQVLSNEEETTNEEPPKKKKKGNEFKIHGIITAARVIMTKSHKKMAIIQIEDTSGKIEGAVFPRVYEQQNPAAFEVDAFVEIIGKAETRDGKVNMIIQTIKSTDLEKIRHLQLNEEYAAKTKTQKTTSATSKTEKKVENKPTVEEGKRENCFWLYIPDGTTKQTVAEIKQILVENKAAAGIEVDVQIEGKMVKIPFKIKGDASIEETIFTHINQDEAATEIVF
ncbi:DNA polymerase III subunit alpha [bacterium DOLZORAL124_38_8]|nr:MAG: DNA polymerase III subunit alpha [bacterium DOLZORAL124_38_8]